MFLFIGPTSHQHKHILHTTSKDRSCCYCYFYFSHKYQNSPRYCHYSSRPRYHFVLFMKGAFHDSTVASFVQSLIESPTFDSTFISSYTQTITPGCNLLNCSGADNSDESVENGRGWLYLCPTSAYHEYMQMSIFIGPRYTWGPIYGSESL